MLSPFPTTCPWSNADPKALQDSGPSVANRPQVSSAQGSTLETGWGR